MLFNPMTGEKGKAQTRKQEGKTQVRLQLHSGESVILQTFNHALTDVAEWKYVQEQPDQPSALITAGNFILQKVLPG